MSPPPAATSVGSIADVSTPEIADLVKSLQHNPEAIFQWVRGNIAFKPYFGVVKGAALTLEERTGNDADTCALLVCMLRQCPTVLSAKYVQGESLLPASGAPGSCNLADWLGMAYEEEAVSHYIKSLCTPDSDIYFYVQDGVRWYSWKRWRVVIETAEGTSYFDPSFKMIEFVAGMDLAAASGYSRANLLSAAGGVLGSDSVESLGKYGFEVEMRARAVALVQHLQTNMSGMDMNHLSGWVRSLPINVSLSGNASDPLLQYNVSSPVNVLPEDVFSALRIRLGGIDKTLYTAELQGRTLWLEMDFQASIYLDDLEVASEPSSTSSLFADFQVSIDHPGTSADESTHPRTVTRVGAKTVSYAFDPGIHSLRRHQLKLQQLQAASTPVSLKRTLAETLCVMGQHLLTQADKTANTIAGFTNVIVKNHHLIGIVTDEHLPHYDIGGYSLDFPLNLRVSTTRGAGTDYSMSGLIAASLTGSAFEHITIAQTQNGDQAASTVRLIAGAGSSSIPKLFWATSQNWSSIKSQLTDYTTNDLDIIEDALSLGASAVVPISGEVFVQDWSGAGYLITQETETFGNVAALITGGYKGGYSGLLEGVSLEDVHLLGMLEEGLRNGAPQSGTPVTGGDPVNMNTGQFVHDAADLVVGSGVMPEGLSFARKYDGSRRLFDSSKLGNGWTHSFDLSARRSSDPELILQNGDAPSTAAYVLGVYILVDLIKNRDGVKDWAVAILAANFTANQLVDNAVSVQLPDRVLQFHRSPNGKFPNSAFQSPPGCTAALTAQTIYDQGPPGVPWVPVPIGETYKLQERHGRLWEFSGANGEFTKVTDLYGRSAALTASAAASRTYSDCYGRSMTLQFDGPDGHLGSVTDSTGRTVLYNVNPNFPHDGRLVLHTVLDARSMLSRFHYDAEMRLVEVLIPASKTVVANTAFDSQHRVIEQQGQGHPFRTWRYFYRPGETIEENPLGERTTHLFDELKRNTGTRDAMGRLFTSEFDAEDRRIMMRTPLGFEETTAYNADHNPTSSTDAAGEITTRTYDTAKRLHTRTDPTGKTSTVSSYNAAHQPLSVTDAAGIITSYTYVPAGQAGAGKPQTLRVNGVLKRRWTYNAQGLVETLREGTDAENKLAATYLYTPLGDVQKITDSTGAETLYTYNPNRQVLSVLQRATPSSAPILTSYTYTSTGDLETVTSPRGHQKTIHYNAIRQPTETILPDGAVLSVGYDLADRPVSSTNELNKVVASVLNAAGQVEQVTDPLARTVSMDYDDDGRATSSTDPLNRTTQTLYNGRGEVTGNIQPDGHGMSQLYDDAGRRTHLTNRSGNTWVFGYDSGGRPNTVTTPAGRVSSTGYDAQGRAWKIAEPSGQEARLVLDAYDRVERTEFFAAAAEMTPQEVVSHTYTVNNQLHATTEGAAVITRSYDPDPRHLISSYTNAAGEVLGYLFDGNGNLTQLTLPDAKTILYGYDNRDRLTSVTDWAGRVTSLQWDAASKLTHVTRHNGTVRSQIYDEAGQLTRIEERTSAGRLIQMVRLGLDAVGRAEKRMTVPLPAAVNFPALNLSYTADNWITGRLYDLDGNLRQVPPVPASLGSPFIGVEPGLLDASGTDVNATWDQRNRLTSLALADSSTLAFTYDAENLRLTKTRGGQTTRYTQNPHGIMGMSEVEIEHLPGGEKRWYVWGGPAGLLYDVTVPAGGGTEAVRYYHADQVGSTMALTDSTGAVTGRLDYTAYGLITRRTGDTDTPFLYNGAYGVMTDSETGLVHMRARYYHPWLARFLNEDPIGFGGGMNWFAFADGNPVLLLDALGLDAQSSGGAFWSLVGSFLQQVASSSGDQIIQEYRDAHRTPDQQFVEDAVVFMSNFVSIGSLESRAASLSTRISANSGGDIFANSYRLGTPSTRANANALNRLNFDRAAPEIVRQRSTQLFSEVSGAPINGYYNQATNQIFLGKGSNLGTLTEELIHAGQRLDYGGRIPSNMINLMEQQAARKLDSLGFEFIEP